MLIYIMRDFLDFVLPPGDFLILGAASAVAARYHRRLTAIFLLLIIWVMMSPWLGQWMVHGLEYADQRPRHLTGDVIVVLGEGAVAETPSNHGMGSLSGSMANEFLTVIRLERILHVPILISGGKGSFSDGNEADIGRNVLFSLHIRDVLIDNRSETTYQNAANSAVILRRHHFVRPILVASAFHMVQAVEDFRAQGIHVVAYPTDYQTPVRLSWLATGWIPSIAGVDLVSEALQEYVSLAAFRLGFIR